jgi:hypothetical protein
MVAIRCCLTLARQARHAHTTSRATNPTAVAANAASLPSPHTQAGAPVTELNMFDRHDQIQDLDHVWTDPPGAQMLYGPRRFEGGRFLCSLLCEGGRHWGGR